MQENVFQLILQASFFVKLILGVLLGFSVISWGIIVYKYNLLHQASTETESLKAAFIPTRDPKAFLAAAQLLEISPLAQVVKAVSSIKGAVSRDRMERIVKRHSRVEIEKLYAYLPFLATTASATPFIGLLGTVWGIINAFRGMANAGSASLGTVAPGIAEALITTAVGLAAAIPAVLAYNYYLNWIRKLNTEVETFLEELLDYLTSSHGHETR